MKVAGADHLQVNRLLKKKKTCLGSGRSSSSDSSPQKERTCVGSGRSSSSDSSPRKERTCLDNSISSSESDDHEPAATFPSRQKKYKQHFREEWKRDLSWLDNTKGKAFCKICQKYLSNNKTNIERHGYGESHKKNECTLKQQPKINQNKKVQTFESKIRKIKIAELKIILFLCVHNLPFALITPLIGLIKSVAGNDEIVKEIKCGRTKTAETINGVLAENFMEDMANCLRHNKFSLIIDESTDISTLKCLGVVARYFDQQKGKIRDRFLKLIEVQKCDARSLFEALKKLFIDLKIPFENVVGFAADNAAVMMGGVSGVKTLLKVWNPNLYVIGCICHSMHLCASTATKTIPPEIEQLVRNIYYFFAHSSKRQVEFQEFQDYFDLKKHKILKRADTRWLSLENAIVRVLEQWPALQTYLASAAFEENNDIAKKILEQMTPLNKCYLLFLSSSLKNVNKINLEFQATEPRFHQLLKTLKLYLKSILNNFMHINLLNFESLSEDTIEDSTMYKKLEDLYLGAQTEMFILGGTLTAEEIYSMQKNCLRFYISLSKQILKRINFKDPVLKALQIIDPLSLGPSLVPLINIFPNLVGNMNIEDINEEWRLLLLHAFSEEEKTLEMFWQNVFKVKNSLGEHMYPHLRQFISSLLCLPHSSASTERVFSQMKLNKTAIRNCLNVETVSSILLIKEIMSEFEFENWVPPKEIINKYQKIKTN